MAMMSVAAHAPGRFVGLIGPAGVGKTAVASALLQHHRGRAAYFHFVPPMRGPLVESLGSQSTPPPKAAPSRSTITGSLRLLRNATRCWVGYLRTVRPALNQNWLIVGDRWMYGYLVQPEPLRFHGPGFLARAVIRLLPRPHLVVNLSAPPQIIRERKQELTLSQIEQELIAWSSLRVHNVHTVDATRQPSDIASDILAMLGYVPAV